HTDPPSADTYPLSLHDALPIFAFPPQLDVVHESHGIGVTLIRDPKLYRYTINGLGVGSTSRIHFTVRGSGEVHIVAQQPVVAGEDRKSTRLNSSHLGISYAVFC